MILMFDKKSWYNSIFRNLFGGIDSLIYSLISWIIEGIFNLANVTANGKLIESIYNRVYLILSIYMIFKLTVSFLRYMASPDMMNDREQGVGKLIARTFTMIVLIIAMPLLFFNLKIDVDGTQKTLLVALQDGALNTLPKLILGVDSAPTSNSKETGDAIAMMMIRNFYFPMECRDNPEDPVCVVTYTRDASGNVSTSNTSALANFDELEDTLDKAGSNGKYAYYYMWPVSTVVGIAMVVILLGLCIDVAIRIFKIIGLEMIAPIPIMSYIDPKSSKDSGMFSNWVKNFISTYVSVFINLGVLYLVLLLISKLMTGELFDSGYHVSGVMSQMFLNVFLIIGLLQFARQAPKFFKDALGIKDRGGSSFMGRAMSGLGGAAAGFAGGLAAGGIAGGLSGAMQGASGAAQAAGTNKPFNAFANARDDAAKMRTGNQNARGGLLGRAQNAAMRAEGRKIAARTYGLTSNGKNGTLDKMKAANTDKQSKAAQAKKIADLLSKGQDSAAEGIAMQMQGADGRNYTSLKNYLDSELGMSNRTANDLTDAETAASMLETDASKFNSDYEEVKKEAERLHVKRGLERYTAGGRIKTRTDEFVSGTRIGQRYQDRMTNKAKKKVKFGDNKGDTRGWYRDN